RSVQCHPRGIDSSFASSLCRCDDGIEVDTSDLIPHALPAIAGSLMAEIDAITIHAFDTCAKGHIRHAMCRLPRYVSDYVSLTTFITSLATNTE
ncbi:hypothetical protein HN011_004804, partial [Eciton burchellii]